MSGEPNWSGIGPMPTDSDLEKQIDSVWHKNDHPQADEARWLKYDDEHASEYAASEKEFIETHRKRQR
jgi:hypothetical protein